MTTREMEQPQSHTIPSVHILHGSAQAPCQAPEDEYGRECLTCIVGVCVRCHMTELATECPGALEHFEAYQTLLNAGILDFRQGSWVFGPGPGAIEREQYRRPSDRRRPEPPSFANLRPEDVVAFEVAWMEARAGSSMGSSRAWSPRRTSRTEMPLKPTSRGAGATTTARRTCTMRSSTMHDRRADKACSQRATSYMDTTTRMNDNRGQPSIGVRQPSLGKNRGGTTCDPSRFHFRSSIGCSDGARSDGRRSGLST